MPGNLVNQSKIDASQVSFSARFNMALMVFLDEPLLEVAMELPSSGAVETHNWLGTIPGFSEWLDDRKLNNLRAEEITITNKDWSNGLKVDRNDILDDRLGIVEPRIAQLARKGAMHYSNLLVDALAEGLAASSTFGQAYDGQDFFDTDHSDGTVTQSNKGTAALDAAAYTSARAQMYSLTDDESDPLGIIPNTLIVGPDNEETALQVVRAEVTDNAGGTASVTNVFAGTARVIVSPRLVGARSDYWFLADLSQEVRPMILQIREAITFAAAQAGAGDFSAMENFMRKTLLYGAQGRHNVGYGLWQMIFGSDGTT